jgi:hypothetical protein
VGQQNNSRLVLCDAARRGGAGARRCKLDDSRIELRSASSTRVSGTDASNVNNGQVQFVSILGTAPELFLCDADEF